MAKETAREWLERHATYSSDECLIWPWSTNKKGYGRFAELVDGKTKNYRANRYMCELANGPPPSPLHQAAHSCGNPSCVNPRHLRWATQGENEKDKYQHGTDRLTLSFAPGHDRKRQFPFAKFDEEDVHQIRRLLAKGVPIAEVARKFGTGYTTVQKINDGITWVWLETPGIKKTPASVGYK